VNESSNLEESPKKTSFIGKLLRLFSCLVVLFIISFVISSYLATEYYNNEGPLTEEKIVIIPDGSSLKSAANKLAKENVLLNPELFTILVRIMEPKKTIKAGQYKFSPNISPAQVFKKMEKGDIMSYSLTIPEGLMSSQIIQLINEAPHMTGTIKNTPKEGELLPETYEYTYNYDRQKLVNRMKNSMQQALDKAWENRVTGLPIKSKEDALILASIIEKETGVESERERVAAVFINRLKKRMRLQTDPTVIYAITKGEYVLERPLSRKDLKMDSPYNTYRNFGLPPGPIANPGQKAINAALNPAITNEYYFVADGTGGHKFSTTLKEHNQGVRNWRRISKQNKQNKD